MEPADNDPSCTEWRRMYPSRTDPGRTDPSWTDTETHETRTDPPTDRPADASSWPERIGTRALIRAAEFERCLQAEALLIDARRTAAAMLAAAQARIRAQKAEHDHRLASEVASERLRGYADGLQRGREEQAAQLIEFRAQLARDWAAQDARLIDLVIAILGRLLSVPDAGAGFFACIAERVRQEVQDARSLVIRVAPSQLDEARASLQQAWNGQALPVFIELRAAPELAPGACRIESERQFIDASLHTQLANIHRVLRQTMAADPPS